MSERPILVTGLSAMVGDLGGPSAILLADGRVAAVDGPARRTGNDAEVVDGTGLVAVPGFIELQLNGIDGHDFTTDPGTMWSLGSGPARYGVTAFLPTIVSAPRGSVDAALEAFRAGGVATGEPVPLGIHAEGPYLAPRRAGAHDLSCLRLPDRAEVESLVEAGGLRILTLAPELPDATAIIERLIEAGVVAAIGHTDADAAATRRGVDAGARYATHLFNAMPPLSHRDPGAVGALLADERVSVGLILDGHHLDPTIVELVARVARGRLSLVSDAIAALGLADGTHRLAGRDVEVHDGRARLPGPNATLAGSVAGLDACVRELARVTGSPRAAVEAVTATPARLLGERDRGHLAVGARADAVLLDADLRVRMTIVGGAVAHEDLR
jgi:N-acetylglucosamine-6-phosphate deacetylase